MDGKSTDCPHCQWEESTLWEKVKIWRRMVFPTTNEQIKRMTESSASLIRVAMGTGPVTTWYERHKRRYIDTGDVVELERMGRHIEEVKW